MCHIKTLYITLMFQHQFLELLVLKDVNNGYQAFNLHNLAKL